MNLERFLSFAESLKLVRRAEIEHDGVDLIDQLYTDLLPNNGIINKVNLPRTTILHGRKGTGKSTIFLKSQKDITNNKKFLSVYIDVKSLYDNSTPELPNEIKLDSSYKELIKYLIYSNFIREIILKTKNNIRNRVEKKFSLNLLQGGELLSNKVFVELDKIEMSIDDVFQSLNASLLVSYKNIVDNKVASDKNAIMEVAKAPSIKLSESNSTTNNFKKEFDNKLVTYLDLKKCLIENLIRIREILGVKHLFIYLDDYSEIEDEAQRLFMDWFIAPLNNNSEDFVKFKIATYPHRFYYGKLDIGKIDEIQLDFFDAYYSYDKKNERTDISRMEELALDYTQRLLDNRINFYFPKNNWEDYFDFKKDKLIKMLFDISLNIPRKIGYILSYCYESCLIHGTKIGKNSIEIAAKKYYNDVIEKYFLVNEHICKPFADKISNENQYDLLIKLVARQMTNKNILKKRRKNKDTSHFYVSKEVVQLLHNLELNGFISTYNKVKNKLNITSTIYSLDFGLCKKHGLTFGTTDTDTHHSYPIFNFSSIIIDYFNSTQVIRCEFDTNHEFPFSSEPEFKKFSMACPTCLENHRNSKCIVTIKFQELREQFSDNETRDKINLTFHEFLMLDYLKIYNTSISLNRLTELLDTSLLSVKNVVKSVIDSGYCEYDIEVAKTTGSEYVRITNKGVKLISRVHTMVKPKKILAEDIPK